MRRGRSSAGTEAEPLICVNDASPLRFRVVGMPFEVLIDIAELLAVCAVVALAAYLLTRIAERL